MLPFSRLIPKGEILDVLAPFSIIGVPVFAVCPPDLIRGLPLPASSPQGGDRYSTISSRCHNYGSILQKCLPMMLVKVFRKELYVE